MRFMEVIPDPACQDMKLDGTFFDAATLTKLKKVVSGLMAAQVKDRMSLEDALAILK